MKEGEWVKIRRDGHWLHNSVGIILGIDREDSILLYRVKVPQKRITYWFLSEELSPISK